MSSQAPVFILTLLIVASTAHKPAHTTEIYRCVSDDGAISFSDRSCRQVSQQKITVEPMPIVGWEKVEAVPYKKRSRRKKPGRSSKAAKLAKNTSKCDKTRAQIEKINSKLRAGYTIKAGERLNERLRELERFRFRNCR
ncbi:MAG: hypothetical protein U9Q75_12310 [Pseudomonadota bacterium]|nr:hypothetical protein [Pseudomonadota bacterium]